MKFEAFSGGNFPHFRLLNEYKTVGGHSLGCVDNIVGLQIEQIMLFISLHRLLYTYNILQYIIESFDFLHILFLLFVVLHRSYTMRTYIFILIRQ